MNYYVFQCSHPLEINRTMCNESKERGVNKKRIKNSCWQLKIRTIQSIYRCTAMTCNTIRWGSSFVKEDRTETTSKTRPIYLYPIQLRCSDQHHTKAERLERIAHSESLVRTGALNWNICLERSRKLLPTPLKQWIKTNPFLS